MWVRSYWVSDSISRDAANASTKFWSWSFAHTGRGRLLLVRHTIDYSREKMREPTGMKWEWKKGVPSPDSIVAGSGTATASWEFAGFHHLWRDMQPDRCDWVELPLWMPAILTAVLPAMGLMIYLPRLLRRRRRERRGLCPVCGYDVRATPVRCPECGMVPENALA